LTDGADGNPVELFAFSGAHEFTGPSINGVGTKFTVEFRGQMAGPAVGATPAERLADAKAKVKAEVVAKMEEVKVEVLKPNVATDRATPSISA
jgi:hypothetical protein